tara:strand:- start:33 stop:440 length:408 start_codon:yes stop_codon:yes gene_type:complete
MSFKKPEITPDTKVGDVLSEKKCSACDTMMVKKAVVDDYQTKQAGKTVLKISSYIDETGQAHLRMEGVGNFICKKTGQSVSGKTQKTITDDPNDAYKNLHVDTHSHADLMKSMQEIKDMMISMKSALATFCEREK